MAIKLNETQRALLGAAAQRGDQLVPFPDGRRLAAARKAAGALLAAGFAREAGVANDRVSVPQQKTESEGETGPEPKTGPNSWRETIATATEPQPVPIAAPRRGTKIDHVVKMLSRAEGATLAAIIKTTGWLPHSTYAALTGLRKRGYALERSRADEAGPSVYRLAASVQADA
jgi:Protein of unknown function (DUF3489)